ncbi:MAG TPA: AI-2E family transporter [Gemmatimonadaceae bacterium]|nr:AI-2E family transporter [Gemmatimonadaceae bacterium]
MPDSTQLRPEARITEEVTVVPRRRWRGGDVLRSTAIVTAYLIGLLLLWIARDIFLTAFIGVLFGLAVSKGAELLTRLRVPRGAGAALVVFGFLGLLYGVGVWIAPTLRAQGALLRERVPEAVDRAEAWLNARPGLAGLILGGQHVTQARTAGVDTALASEAKQRTAADTANAASVPSIRQRVSQELSGASRYFFPFLSSTITIAAGLFLILVLSIYIGADPLLYRSGLLQLMPSTGRARAAIVLARVATVLRKWLVTQLIAMVVIGVAATTALLILGVKAAVALGVIAGLLEFVPTIGPILSAVPAVAMGFLDSPEKALYVALAYLLIQQLEGHLLIPILMKEGMDLPPALTIITQGVMALLFGFLGLLVAVPMLAAVIALVKTLYVEDVIGDVPPTIVVASADGPAAPA